MDMEILLCDTANVMIELATHKNLILVVSQSKIEPKLANLDWAGIGPKLGPKMSIFG